MAAFPNDIVDLLVQLINIESKTGEEGPAVEYLAAGLRAEGWSVQLQPIGNEGRANVYATRRPIGEKHPRLVFNSHIDVVPPHIPARVDEKNVYGRGSNDAKGQVAAMIMAGIKIVKEYPELADDIGLLFVVGEELDHCGMIDANNLPGFAPDYLIVGEPTEMKFMSSQKGACKIKLTCHGRAGHSGYPDAGESAVHKMVEILHDLLKYDWPKDERMGDTIINIGLINGGQALNAWAAEAEASIFLRVTTSYADIKDRVDQIVNGRAELDHSLGGVDPVALTLPDFPHQASQAAFNTDVGYYSKHKELKGVFLFGAGSIHVAHALNEFIPISELRQAVEEHVRLARTLLEKKE